LVREEDGGLQTAHPTLLGVTDAQRATKVIKGADGKRLTYQSAKA
jgi:hypothetical protein